MTQSNNDGKSAEAYKTILKSISAGAGAGFICTIICAPLDVVKVRLQVQSQLGITKYR